MFFVAPEMVVLSVVLLAGCACVHVQMSLGRRGCTEARQGCWLGSHCCFCLGCAESEGLYLTEQLVGGWAPQRHGFPTV